MKAGGWDLVDTPAGAELRPGSGGRLVTLVAIDWGWPEDAQRWLRSARSFSNDKQVLRLVTPRPDLGWAVIANSSVDHATTDFVILFDPSIEVTGDVVGPLLEALKDPTVALAGPYGVRGKGTVKEFESHPGPEVDAIEGYCMAFRKADFLAVGGFDRKFRFYRIADIVLSFRLRAEGNRRAVVVPVPVVKHEHRVWESMPEPERQRLSKKNFYLFLDRWRDREDLLTDRGQEGGDS